MKLSHNRHDSEKGILCRKKNVKKGLEAELVRSLADCSTFSCNGIFDLLWLTLLIE